jgi:hypothetical protein
VAVAVAVGAAGAGPQAASALKNNAAGKKSDSLFMIFLLHLFATNDTNFTKK